MHLITLPLIGFLFSPFFRKRLAFKRVFIMSALWQVCFYFSCYFFYALYTTMPYFLEGAIRAIFIIDIIFFAVAYLYLNYLIKFNLLDSPDSLFSNNAWLKRLEKFF